MDKSLLLQVYRSHDCSIVSIEVEGRKFRDPPVLERLLDQLDSNSEFRFLRFVGRARGRGSPRRVDPSLPRSGNVRSYLTRVEGEISCISALSTNNVHRRWSSASPTTPGVQAIPRLVIACYYAPLLPSWTTVLL